MKAIRSMKSMPKPLKSLLLRCRQAVEEIDPTAEVILYGSRARGDAQEDSDYDLLILSDNEATLALEDRFRRRLYAIELDTGAVLTVILTSKRNWNSPLYAAMPLYGNIRKDGVHL